MKFRQHKWLKSDTKPTVPKSATGLTPTEILARLRERAADARKFAAQVDAPIDYDVMKRAMSRRTSFDKREPGVSEPSWEEKATDTVVMTISPETIEMLCIASMRHSCCNDADFEIRYSYGSGIGTNIVAKCTRCGKRYDITDYGSW